MKRRASSGTSMPVGSSNVSGFLACSRYAAGGPPPGHRVFAGQNDPVDEVQLLVADQARPGEIAGADDGRIGRRRSAAVVGPTLSWWNRYALAWRKPLS